MATVVTPGQSAGTPPGPAPERGPRTYESQGLTAAGVAVVVLTVSLVGLLVDAFTGGGIGWLFGGCFIAVSGYAAAQVRRRDLAWAVIDPPLVFALLVVLYDVVTKTGDLLTKAVSGLNGLLDYGPMLWIGTGLAAVIVAYRAWSFRRARRP